MNSGWETMCRSGAGRMAPDHDLVGIAAIGARMVAYIFDGGRYVIIRGGILGLRRRQAIIGFGGDHAVLNRPDHDVVIHELARTMFVPARKAAAMDVDQDRFARALARSEQIELLRRIGPKGKIAADLDVGGHALVHRDEEACGLGIVDVTHLDDGFLGVFGQLRSSHGRKRKRD